MIYDFHTYDIKPRSVPELERGVAEVLPARLEISHSPRSGTRKRVH